MSIVGGADCVSVCGSPNAFFNPITRKCVCSKPESEASDVEFDRGPARVYDKEGNRQRFTPNTYTYHNQIGPANVNFRGARLRKIVGVHNKISRGKFRRSITLVDKKDKPLITALTFLKMASEKMGLNRDVRETAARMLHYLKDEIRVSEIPIIVYLAIRMAVQVHAEPIRVDRDFFVEELTKGKRKHVNVRAIEWRWLEKFHGNTHIKALMRRAQRSLSLEAKVKRVAERLAAELELEPKIRVGYMYLINKVLKLKDVEAMGRSPSSVAAALLFIAIKLFGGDPSIKQTDIAKVARVSDATIRKNYLRLLRGIAIIVKPVVEEESQSLLSAMGPLYRHTGVEAPTSTGQVSEAGDLA